VLPYAKTPEDEHIAETMGEMVWGIPNLETAFLDLLDAIGKGFALAEIIWGVEQGQARVVELNWVPQKKVTFVEDLAPRLMTADGPWQGGWNCPPGRSSTTATGRGAGMTPGRESFEWRATCICSRITP